MNTNSINTISKYLLLFLLILTGASCNDNDDAEDTSIPVLISQNINDGDVVGPSGYVELTFSKAMRQAPDTEIYFNGGVVRVSINYEKVRYTFSGMENKECTFEVPAGALTDMQGRAYDEDFFLSFTAKSEISGGGKVFDAIVDSKGNGGLSPIRIHGGPVIGTIQPLIVHTFITHGLKVIQIISGEVAMYLSKTVHSIIQAMTVVAL